MTDESAVMKSFTVPSGVLRVLHVLESAGFEAWLVGGCVRDHLRGIAPKDYDVTTSASAAQVTAAFDGFRVIETGVRHGTVTVISDAVPVEVTTYRIDGAYSDGRHPDSVRFTSEIADDLSRRDFTVNAMAYAPDRGYIDLFGGMNDLQSGIIRCVGEPQKRFGEDALRILRALRFASVLGFEIEPRTSQAIHQCKGLLERIAVERITQELFGLLCGVDAERILRQYSDVIAGIIPPCGEMFGFEQHNPHHDFDVWEHTLRVIGESPPDRMMRLSALLHDIGKPRCFTLGEDGVGHFYGHAGISEEIAAEVFRRFIRTDKRTEQRVIFLVGHHDEPLLPDRRIMRRRLAKYGEEALRQLIALHRADVKGQTQQNVMSKLEELDRVEQILNALTEESACTTLRSLEISGGDLMAMGIPKGPLIGKILSSLLSEVCDERLVNSPEALRARAAAIYEDFKSPSNTKDNQ